MSKNVQGCNTNPTARYHNQRADFKATDASRIMISIEGTRLSIQIDAKNSGDWQECVQLQLPELSHDWLINSYMGITASTGSLGDNHDVFSVSTDTNVHSSTSVVANEKRMIAGGLEKLPVSRLYSQNPNGPVEARLLSIENTLNDILIRLQEIDLHHEHSSVDSMEKIKNIVGKLSKREDKAEIRLEKLEQMVEDQVREHLDEHQNEIDLLLESRTHEIKNEIQSTFDEVAESIEDHETKFENHKKRTAKHLENIAGNMAKGTGNSSSWQMPFYFLLFLVLGGGIAIYLWIADLKRLANEGLANVGYTRQHYL
jgi:hypothetical protein